MFQLPKIHYSENVITVQDLISALKKYPPNAEVWIGTRNNLSNELKEVCPLNAREDGCDVILNPETD